ncbi:hypothetical protein [Candidatus Nitrosotenuis chungbukensis]|uniref:hypothetical protein n=2 Tax=Candidatus Nitrosotenuis chungbukensis TaxID=1353246 RepID=UPI000694374B|nr:hypothetical protein [Candidatus Nitrosotenuis chungbukensis]
MVASQLLFLVTCASLFTSVSFAENTPDYYKPYAPIYTDKQVYTWTDKVHITIVSPAWNENIHAIDSIGDDRYHQVKISTASNSLGPYRLTETSPNSGTFAGEVTLTGFSHDVDGDGVSDTTPRTSGNGPTSGLLEAKRDDGITISFEFADGVVLTKSVKISWNVGEIAFSNLRYLPEEQIKIQVNDPDMNLNPENLDQVKITVSTESDSAGISVIAVETQDDSGVFESTISLTQTSGSSGNRIRAFPGELITAKYEDRTLPLPYGISDDLDIIATSSIGADIPDIQRVSIEDLYVADSTGEQISKLTKNNQIQIVSHIRNNQDYSQQFTSIVQIVDEQNRIVSLSWIAGKLSDLQNFELSQSWIPTESGNYRIETFVWKSLNDPSPLAPSYVKSFSVK